MTHLTTILSEATEGSRELGRNERARAMFPAEWARMETLTGKPRSRLRARLRNQADYLTGLKMLPADARCGTCLHRGRFPGDNRSTCDLDSDFYGYQIVALDHRCLRWTAITAHQKEAGHDHT